MAYQENQQYAPIPRLFKTEEELNQGINVVKIKIYGSYTCRGDHRKEVIEKNYKAFVEVPENFNKGHVKLAANRYIKKSLQGIRSREFFIDETFKPEPVTEYRRRVRDFISDKGMRDNARLKRNYDRDMAKRNSELQAMGGGQAPGMQDFTQYDKSGLPPMSDEKYFIDN